MLGIDSLIVIGAATISLGTIQESDGTVDRSFWLRNDYSHEVSLIQGYTSCGCTTIDFAKDTPILPDDSTLVQFHFNPRGKGGEFYESGTVVYNIDAKRHFAQVSIEGTCITSEETLLKQYPIDICEGLRQSTNHFDVGYMSVGQSKELNVSILHQEEDNRRELIPVTFTVDAQTPKGLQHIKRIFKTFHRGKETEFSVLFDVFVK